MSREPAARVLAIAGLALVFVSWWLPAVYVGARAYPGIAIAKHSLTVGASGSLPLDAWQKLIMTGGAFANLSALVGAVLALSAFRPPRWALALHGVFVLLALACFPMALEQPAVRPAMGYVVWLIGLIAIAVAAGLSFRDPGPG